MESRNPSSSILTLLRIIRFPCSTEVPFKNKAGIKCPDPPSHSQSRELLKSLLPIACRQPASHASSRALARSNRLIDKGRKRCTKSGKSEYAITGDRKSCERIFCASLLKPFRVPDFSRQSNTVAPKLPPDTPLIAKT